MSAVPSINNPIRRGIERETLRATRAGSLALTPHPAALGQKLSHGMITTDFSESQLELITPVEDSIDGALATLRGIHQFAAENLGNELLWPASMPCDLPPDADIPLAQYGPSNLGRLKTTYRNGLGLRYGRAMQTICAIHYNFSLTDEAWQTLYEEEHASEPMQTFRTRRYFDLMRNFRRWSWLPIYLFAASPAVASSFLQHREHDLAVLNKETLYLPYATSLRNGSLGYQSDTQATVLKVCYNGLPSYVETLCRGICTPHAGYRFPGEHVQVNENILQSEAEFYTTVRAKRVPPPGANFLQVLYDEGVEYLEIRLLDINPFKPMGLDATEIAFLDTFLLHCLVTESPFHDDALCDAVRDNLLRTVYEGRKPGLTLDDQGSERQLADWGKALMDDMATTAGQMGPQSEAALAAQRAKLDDTSLTPSEQVLGELSGSNFIEFGLRQANALRAQLLDTAPEPALRQRLIDQVTSSRTAQADIDARDEPPFAEYLEDLQADYQTLLDRFPA